MGCAEAYTGTASGRGQVRDSVEILVLLPPQAVAILAGGPTAPGRKRTLSGRKLVTIFSLHIPSVYDMEAGRYVPSIPHASDSPIFARA